MHQDSTIKLNNTSLAIILRANLSCYLGKVITQEHLSNITLQIIESIDFILNKQDEKL